MELWNSRGETVEVGGGEHEVEDERGGEGGQTGQPPKGNPPIRWNLS